MKEMEVYFYVLIQIFIFSFSGLPQQSKLKVHLPFCLLTVRCYLYFYLQRPGTSSAFNLGYCVGLQQHTMGALFAAEVPQLGLLGMLSALPRLIPVIQ